MNKTAYDMIKRHEGVRLKPYKDTKGLLTIGVGRNLEGKGITMEEAEYLYRNDLQDVEEQCAQLCPAFYKLSEGRQAALMDMCMMGKNRLAGFKKMFTAIARSDWKEAGAQAKNSKWYVDVGPNRGNDVVNLLIKG